MRTLFEAIVIDRDVEISLGEFDTITDANNAIIRRLQSRPAKLTKIVTILTGKQIDLNPLGSNAIDAAREGGVDDLDR